MHGRKNRNQEASPVYDSDAIYRQHSIYGNSPVYQQQGTYSPPTPNSGYVPPSPYSCMFRLIEQRIPTPKQQRNKRRTRCGISTSSFPRFGGASGRKYAKAVRGGGKIQNEGVSTNFFFASPNSIARRCAPPVAPKHGEFAA